MEDDLMAQFCAITDTDTNKAAAYLRLTDGNMEQAVQLYFEDPNLAIDAGSSSTETRPMSELPVGPAHRSRQYTEDENGIVHVADDADDSDDSDVDLDLDEPDAATERQAQPSLPLYSSATEDDEAMARRLQEEMYRDSGRDSKDVRAPIERRTQTLVGGNDFDDLDVQSVMAQQMAMRQARRNQASRPGVFNQRDTQSAIWDDPDLDEETRATALSRATGGASTTSSKATTLAEMFRPPFEIISRVTWDQAREEGKVDRKWLLVNVQDPSVFDCQVLNRDLWKDERVRGLIQESFIFLQYSRDDQRANAYINYYFAGSRDVQSAYPHIAIVDPRTGEQVKAWSGSPIPKVNDFLEDLTNFLVRYSLDASAKNPVARRKPESSKVNIDRMTENEMLEMALQASLASEAVESKPEDPDDLTKSTTLEGNGKGKVTSSDGSDDVEMVSANDSGPVPATAFSQISSFKLHEEPAPDSTTTTRIQFRYSGGRLVRRFCTTDPVRRIYEWMKAAPLEGKGGLEFDLMFMGKNLMDMIDMTIEEAGLKNGSVNMEFLGQDEE